MATQQVRFCRSFDDTGIAYAVTGQGPTVVLQPSWLTHLDYQWRNLAWQPWLQALAQRYRLIRYDPRGCGLSDHRIDGLTFETWVRDFEPLADDLDLHDWAREDYSFLSVFASQFQPEGSAEHLRAWCDLQRAATTPSNAAALTRVMFDLDVLASAARVACPTLVAHRDRDVAVPVEEGRLLAQTIPGAQFLALDSPNHFLLAGEPAWASIVQSLHEFLPPPDNNRGAFAVLTPRERELLELLARGMDNLQIAARLDISEKTARNHVSNIFAKLSVETRAQAIVAAREAGYGLRSPGA